MLFLGRLAADLAPIPEAVACPPASRPKGCSAACRILVGPDHRSYPLGLHLASGTTEHEPQESVVAPAGLDHRPPQLVVRI